MKVFAAPLQLVRLSKMVLVYACRSSVRLKLPTWLAFGVGASLTPIMFTTIAKGGHVRVGMEDNVYLSKGVLAKSNVEFVERTVRISKEFGREVATPDEARQIMRFS